MAYPEQPASEFARTPEPHEKGRALAEPENHPYTSQPTSEWPEPGSLPLLDNKLSTQSTSGETKYLPPPNLHHAPGAPALHTSRETERTFYPAIESAGPLKDTVPATSENSPAQSEDFIHIKQARRRLWLETGYVPPIAGGAPDSQRGDPKSNEPGDRSGQLEKGVAALRDYAGWVYKGWKKHPLKQKIEQLPPSQLTLSDLQEAQEVEGFIRGLQEALKVIDAYLPQKEPDAE
jgi:hypothetical protein